MTNTSGINPYRWYGKLPSAGDFLQRRFPEALQHQWSHWFQTGLVAWHQEHQHDGEEQFNKAPVWNFIVPPMLGSQMIQMGCVLPGRDSVGRQYPLCIQLCFTPAEWAAYLPVLEESWYQQIGRAGVHAMQNSLTALQFDELLQTIPVPQPSANSTHSAILDIIGYEGDTPTTLSWPQVAENFDPLRQTSFWWTNRCDGYPLYTHTHSGNFTGQLFMLLFEPAKEGQSGHHSLYPPMFE